MSQIGQAPTPANHNAHHHMSTNGAHLHIIWTSSTSTIKPHTSLHSNVRSRFYEVDSWSSQIYYMLLTFLFTYLLCPLQCCVLRSPVSSFSSDLLSIHPSLILRCVVPPASTSSCQDIIPQLSTHHPLDPLLRVSYLQTFHLHYSADIINPVHLNQPFVWSLLP